jgi:hypothetical protein
MSRPESCQDVRESVIEVTCSEIRSVRFSNLEPAQFVQ